MEDEEKNASILKTSQAPIIPANGNSSDREQ